MAHSMPSFVIILQKLLQKIWGDSFQKGGELATPSIVCIVSCAIWLLSSWDGPCAVLGRGTCNYEMINLVMHYNVLTRLLSKSTSRIS